MNDKKLVSIFVAATIILFLTQTPIFGYSIKYLLDEQDFQDKEKCKNYLSESDKIIEDDTSKICEELVHEWNCAMALIILILIIIICAVLMMFEIIPYVATYGIIFGGLAHLIAAIAFIVHYSNIHKNNYAQYLSEELKTVFLMQLINVSIIYGIVALILLVKFLVILNKMLEEDANLNRV